MPATLNLDHLSPDERKEPGIRKPRESQFTKDELRGGALTTLALMANLSRAEGERVLKAFLEG
jgi:hypothetical protein